jgi:hypothetical protein
MPVINQHFKHFTYILTDSFVFQLYMYTTLTGSNENYLHESGQLGLKRLREASQNNKQLSMVT